MKKILLPTLLATSVAPVVSLIGCVNSISKTFKLDGFARSGPEFDFFRNDVDLSANTWYQANIDTSKHASELVNTKSWAFIVNVVSQKDKTASAVITNAKVWIDGKQLQQVAPKPHHDLQIDEFIIEADKEEGLCAIYGARNLDGKHKIKIQFQIEDYIKHANLVFPIVNQS